MKKETQAKCFDVTEARTLYANLIKLEMAFGRSEEEASVSATNKLLREYKAEIPK